MLVFWLFKVLTSGDVIVRLGMVRNAPNTVRALTCGDALASDSGSRILTGGSLRQKAIHPPSTMRLMPLI